jgi:saccharopine dehydrogenase-like NADP-dependent oxidoreductase
MFRGTLRYEGFAKIFAELIKSGMTGTNETFALAYKHFRTNTHSSHPSFHAVDWLLSDETLTNDQLNAPALETLATILTNKLALQPGERDLCLMQHSFNEGERVSTLLAYGDGFDTGMAKTVGFTVAIGARLFLDHSSPLKGNVRGILLPTEKRIYKPVLTQLEKENIIFQHHKCRSDYNIKINI